MMTDSSDLLVRLAARLWQFDPCFKIPVALNAKNERNELVHAVSRNETPGGNVMRVFLGLRL